MEKAGSEIEMSDLSSGSHVCFFYQTEADHQAVVTEYLAVGIGRGDKVIYIMDAHCARTIEAYLEDHLSVETYISTGQLQIMTFAHAYMYGSTFNPERMLRVIRNETEIAIAEGWSGLRTTVEMTWVLRRWPGSGRLLEYESRSDDFYRRSRCTAMCQYDRRHLNPALLLHALSTHPLAAIGRHIYENPYYRVPMPSAGRVSNSVLLARCLKQFNEYSIPRVMRASRRRNLASALPFTNLPESD